MSNSITPQPPMNDLSHTQPTRITPTYAQLKALVETQIEALVRDEQDFTAYQVTLDLRTANPNLEIDHAEVRDRVHSEMQAMIAAGLPYGSDNRTYSNGRDALTYMPLTTLQALRQKAAQLTSGLGLRIAWPTFGK